jgi:hypothetical protein
MSTAEAEELGRVWTQVKHWPARLQVALARRILDAIDTQKAPGPPPRGLPVSDLVGLAAGSGELPSDEQVRQWIDEHRMEKYGHPMD